MIILGMFASIGILGNLNLIIHEILDPKQLCSNMSRSNYPFCLKVVMLFIEEKELPKKKQHMR
jgi:hypothetical protein